jgi:hypothetical protein
MRRRTGHRRSVRRHDLRRPPGGRRYRWQGRRLRRPGSGLHRVTDNRPLTPADSVGYGGGGWGGCGADGDTNQRDSDNYPCNGSRGGLTRDGGKGGDRYVLITPWSGG